MSLACTVSDGCISGLNHAYSTWMVHWDRTNTKPGLGNFELIFKASGVIKMSNFYLKQLVSTLELVNRLRPNSVYYLTDMLYREKNCDHSCTGMNITLCGKAFFFKKLTPF